MTLVAPGNKRLRIDFLFQRQTLVRLRDAVKILYDQIIKADAKTYIFVSGLTAEGRSAAERKKDKNNDSAESDNQLVSRIDLNRENDFFWILQARLNAVNANIRKYVTVYTTFGFAVDDPLVIGSEPAFKSTTWQITGLD